MIVFRVDMRNDLVLSEFKVRELCTNQNLAFVYVQGRVWDKKKRTWGTPKSRDNVRLLWFDQLKVFF